MREVVFWTIGNTIALLCRIGGWFIPMYGAGRLERWNVSEYEDAARLAREAGSTAMLDCLLTMAEVEWEHERFFREQIHGHWLLRVFPMWPPLPAKETIRAPYADLQGLWTTSQTPAIVTSSPAIFLPSIARGAAPNSPK
jgi:hypothetical protein